MTYWCSDHQQTEVEPHMPGAEPTQDQEQRFRQEFPGAAAVFDILGDVTEADLMDSTEPTTPSTAQVNSALVSDQLIPRLYEQIATLQGELAETDRQNGHWRTEALALLDTQARELKTARAEIERLRSFHDVGLMSQLQIAEQRLAVAERRLGAMDAVLCDRCRSNRDDLDALVQDAHDP